MGRLKAGIPRAFSDHRRKESRLYGEAVRALYERFPKMPSCARPFVKEYGRTVIELHRNAPALDHAVEKRRMREARRLRLEARRLRLMLLRLQSQIERLAGEHQPTADPLADLFDEDDERGEE